MWNTPVLPLPFKAYVWIHRAIDFNVGAELYLRPCQTSTVETFAKILNGFYTETIFAKVHHRCLIGPHQLLLTLWTVCFDTQILLFLVLLGIFQTDISLRKQTSGLYMYLMKNDHWWKVFLLKFVFLLTKDIIQIFSYFTFTFLNACLHSNMEEDCVQKPSIWPKRLSF